MNTGQLEHALRTNQLTSKLFRAVVAADRLPTSANQPGIVWSSTQIRTTYPDNTGVVLHFTSSTSSTSIPWSPHSQTSTRPTSKQRHFLREDVQHVVTRTNPRSSTHMRILLRLLHPVSGPTQNCTNWTSLVTI